MHPYDSSRAPSRTSPVSHTPIYDALYSEYLRAFRALPGDRTGEEDLGFTAFSYGGAYSGSGSGWGSAAWQQVDPWQPSYTPQPVPAYAYAGQSAAAGSGHAGGRQSPTGMTHVPAALPPAPRRGY